MWVVGGLLLGIVLAASVLGFHIGPHGHVVAGAFGLTAAAWLVVMALTGQPSPLLWGLFGADLALTGAVAVFAWKGLQALHAPPQIQSTRVEGAAGIAESKLDPYGVVRVHGETWSATSLNGNVAAGDHVQVVSANGVRLEVWGEDQLAVPAEPDVSEAGSVFDVPSGAPPVDRKVDAP